MGVVGLRNLDEDGGGCSGNLDREMKLVGLGNLDEDAYEWPTESLPGECRLLAWPINDINLFTNHRN